MYSIGIGANTELEFMFLGALYIFNQILYQYYGHFNLIKGTTKICIIILDILTFIINTLDMFDGPALHLGGPGRRASRRRGLGRRV